MAVVAGQRRTDTIAAHQRKIDMASEIMEVDYNPNESPLLQFTKKLNSKGAVNPEFKWSEYAADVHIDAVNDTTNLTSSDTVFTVDTGELFYAGAIIHVPRTAENMLVSSVSTNDLTVVRGYGASTGAALLDNDVIFILGYAAEEGADSAPARTRNPVSVTNYTEITRTSVSESGTARSSDNETTPHDWDFQIKVKGREHKVSIEKKYWFGSPGEEAGSVGKRRTTGGVLHFLALNRQDAGGALTAIEIETWIRTITRFGSKKKTVFISPLVGSVLGSFALTQLKTDVGQKVYGVNVMKWISTHGELNLVTHDLFVGPYSGYAVAIDFAKQNVAHRFLNGGVGGSRDTHINENIQDPGVDGREDEWLTESGLQLGNPEFGGVLYGVTSAG